MEIKWNYYQFRKTQDYPTYLRVRRDESLPKFLHVLQEMGFNELSETESKKISLHRIHTRVLSVQLATPKVQLQLQGSDLLDQYGPESLNIQNGTPLYMFRKVGVLAAPTNKTLWDLALTQDLASTDHMIGLRVLLSRYLSMALSDLGVLCYFGTFKENTVMIMKQSQSFGETVILDQTKKMIYSFNGAHPMPLIIKVSRRDKETSHGQRIGREELIGFLSVSTCLMSFSGISPAMKKMVFELSQSMDASYPISETVANL